MNFWFSSIEKSVGADFSYSIIQIGEETNAPSEKKVVADFDLLIENQSHIKTRKFLFWEKKAETRKFLIELRPIKDQRFDCE